MCLALHSSLRISTGRNKHDRCFDQTRPINTLHTRYSQHRIPTRNRRIDGTGQNCILHLLTLIRGCLTQTCGGTGKTQGRTRHTTGLGCVILHTIYIHTLKRMILNMWKICFHGNELRSKLYVILSLVSAKNDLKKAILVPGSKSYIILTSVRSRVNIPSPFSRSPVLPSG